MKRFCPDCKTANHPSVAHCDSCGCRLPEPEEAKSAFSAVAILAGLLTLAVMLRFVLAGQ